jgi:hypothetical protein
MSGRNTITNPAPRRAPVAIEAYSCPSKPNIMTAVTLPKSKSSLITPNQTLRQRSWLERG